MFTKSDKKNKEVNVNTTNENASNSLQTTNDMDRLFEQFMSNRWLSPFSWRFPEFQEFTSNADIRVPSVDVVENENNIVLKAEIPGVDKKDIDITIRDNTATIQGKVRKEEKSEKGEYHRCEISNSSFSRTVALPAEIDAKQTTAKFENGVLTITLPKTGTDSRHKVDVE